MASFSHKYLKMSMAKISLKKQTNKPELSTFSKEKGRGCYQDGSCFPNSQGKEGREPSGGFFHRRRHR